ncbi:hypothetical protein D3C80_1891050 [compost metagenome]
MEHPSVGEKLSEQTSRKIEKKHIEQEMHESEMRKNARDQSIGCINKITQVGLQGENLDSNPIDPDITSDFFCQTKQNHRQKDDRISKNQFDVHSTGTQLKFNFLR